jgi:CheY-like chemotaxis protein
MCFKSEQPLRRALDQVTVGNIRSGTRRPPVAHNPLASAPHEQLSAAEPHFAARYITLWIMNTLTMKKNSTQHRGMHTILVVEDEMMVRMPIAEYLRDCGYNVVEAADASEAIAITDAEGPVSVVFSDIRMPGTMDGFGLAEWFRANYPSVPVLLTSGYNGGRSLSSAAIPGIRFIEKPYSQVQVEKRIASLLDS